MNRAVRRTAAGKAALVAPRPWHGRRGPVVLGPTEDRVARYLDTATRNGRVTIRAVDLAARLKVERSEIYRITRRLRVLGLFGIENDQGGQAGGRRYWRTAIAHDGAELDTTRHRDAWARVVGWSRSTAARAAELTHAARAAITYATGPGFGMGSAASLVPVGPAAIPPAVGPPALSFHDAMRAAGLGSWVDDRRRR